MKGTIYRSAITCSLLILALLVTSCSKDPQKAKAKYLASGEAFMQKGKYGDAAVQFRNTLRIDPQYADGYYQLAQAELALRDWRSAYASLNKVIELDANRTDARIDRGRLYLSAREFQKAESDGEDILRRDASNIAGLQLRGAALLGQLKSEQALSDFKRVADLQPQDASAFVDLALVEISLRNSRNPAVNYSDAAEAHLKKAVSLNPKFVPAYTNLANLHQLNKQPAEAEQVLRAAISTIPDGTLLYLDLAALLANQGKKSDSEAVLERLRKQVPKSADAAQAIGDFYIARREIDRAVAEYQRGLSISSNNLELKKRLEDVYLTTGRTKQAADVDQQLMKDSPKDPAVRVNHGRVLTAQGDFSNAILYLQKIVTDGADPDPGRAHYYLAMAYWQNGDLVQARSSLLDTLRVYRGVPATQMSSSMRITLEALTRISLVQGNAKDAQTYAQELVDGFPVDPASRQLLWETLARQQQLRAAEEQILKAKELSPEDPSIRVDLAQTYAAEQKWSEAQKEFEAARQLDPRSATVLGQYADYLMARNQLPQATAHVQEYVAANPNDADGHIILGALYHKAKNYGPAQAEFERAIQLDPTHNQAYIRLAAVFKEQGQVDLAIARYQKALELQPKSAPLATMVGNLYLEKGDLETAQKYYARALDADPNFAVALSNTAWVYAQQDKNLDVALGMAQKAKSLMPDVPSITDTLGWVMYKRGNYENAVPLLEECVQKSKDSAKFRYHLGLTLLKVGQTTRAKQQLETALRMNLDAVDAQMAHQALTQTN